MSVVPIFFEQTIDSEQYVSDILRPFFENITEKERTQGCFMQDGATAHTVNDSINVFNEVFADRPISCRLWPQSQKVKVTLRPTISWSVCLGVEPHLGLMTRH
jgi:hypothetical protein